MHMHVASEKNDPNAPAVAPNHSTKTSCSSRLSRLAPASEGSLRRAQRRSPTFTQFKLFCKVAIRMVVVIAVTYSTAHKQGRHLCTCCLLLTTPVCPCLCCGSFPAVSWNSSSSNAAHSPDFKLGVTSLHADAGHE